MKPAEALAAEHVAASRRFFLRLATIQAAGVPLSRIWAEGDQVHPTLVRAIERLTYLTPDQEFRYVGRLQPRVSEMSPEERKAARLTRDTWRLEVMADPDSDARVRAPLTLENGNALTFDQLLEIGKTKAVSYLKVMTCNNIADPLGMGLWEGVPLRDVLWKVRPDPKIRRVHYHGFHHEDPKWLFRSSLSINRVLEDPPGGQPIILCYKLNGSWLSPERGAPVRMLVPDAYGFKSVKWLQRIFLTTSHLNNDTYAEKGNDVESRMKSYARILHWNEEVANGAAIPLTGVAQCGTSGLTKVQYWLKPKSLTWPVQDRYYEQAPWVDATILPPPTNDWGDMLPNQKLPSIRHQIDAQGHPVKWPLANTIVHFAALLRNVTAGEYELRVRTVDGNGVAQPMPRPFQKSGGNAIQSKPLRVTG